MSQVVIDPDALFAGRDAEGSVEFWYAGHAVTVRADHTIDVSET